MPIWCVPRLFVLSGVVAEEIFTQEIHRSGGRIRYGEQKDAK